MKKKLFAGQKIMPGHQLGVKDWIVVEDALQIDINGKPYTVTMRTPGSDLQLIRGLLYTENIYSGTKPPEIRVSENEGTIASVWIDPNELKDGYYQSRSLLSVSSCGICGKRELDDLKLSGDQINFSEPLDPSEVPEMMLRMNASQRIFFETGGAHAAAAFTLQGQLLAIQEDIGRHNAVDKVIGQLLDEGKLSEAQCITVSGRVSFEIVSKTFKAGIPFLAAVSSPSSMAVSQAKALGIALMAFCRKDTLTCYSNPHMLLKTKSNNVQSINHNV